MSPSHAIIYLIDINQILSFLILHRWGNRLWWLICSGSFSYEVSPPGPTAFLSLWVSISPPPSLPFWHLLLLPLSWPWLSWLTVFQSTCLAAGVGRVQPHPGCVLMGAPCPGSQTRVEEGLLGDLDKLPLSAFQVGELRPREGTGLTQGHTAGTPMPLPLQILPLCH